LTGALPPWRLAVSGEQAAQLLPPIPLAALPPADYTLYTAATPDSSTFADYDLIFFTFSVGREAPLEANTSSIDAPADASD
ncbi:MAG: hypothetical protein GY859_34825, partial [Desulfobacterales bacterium]|nr:hypothetical protein [Desulfobacterales bacterium]